MQLGKGFLFLCVVTTAALLSQGALASQDAKGHKKNKKRKQQTDITPADPAGTNPVDNEPVVNPEVPAVVEDPVEEDIVPSEAHNGKLGKKQRKEQKKAARKAEKKAAKKAARHEHRDHADKAAKKAARKAAKKAERKAARKLQKQEEAGTQIVSFDDIVEDRHGDPIPSPLPPVEGTATESQNTGTAKQNKKAERRHHRKEQRRHNKGHTECASSSDCPHGSCCIEKKGVHYCKPSKKDVGQKCVEDCQCRSGLHCITEEIAPGKEKGVCRVRGTAQVDTGDNIGALEDAVENVINKNQ